MNGMDYEDLIQKTVELRSEGRLEESRNLVVEYLRREPKNINALYLLTDLLEDPDEKLDVLNQILKINPKNRDIHEKIKKLQLNNAIDTAFKNSQEGNIDQALLVVDRVLKEDNKMPSAWYLKANLSKSPSVVKEARAELERLSATNEDAKLYLEQLSSKAVKSGNKKRSLRTGYLFIIAALIILLAGICGIVFPYVIGFGDPTPTQPSFAEDLDTLAVEVMQTQDLLTCEEIIRKAIGYAEDVCSGLSSNQACYGNQNVFANFVPDYTGRFEMVGDLVELDKLTKIVASPLQYEEQLWGIAFLKLQANLPGTLPGQNVTFLVFGDTVLENSSQNMSTFYFTTGLTGISCEQVDYDGLFVSMPDGSGISFQSNGVDILLQGDAILQAKPAGEMSVSMLSGSSELSANGQTVSVNAGSYSTIPMSENLQPSGPISEPKPLSGEILSISCQLLGIGCPGTPIPTVTLTATPTETVTATVVVQNSTSTKPPTSPPPTKPPSSGTCADIKFSGSGAGPYTIKNNYGTDIMITWISLTWPDGVNGAWTKTYLSGRLIHSKKINTSPASAELFADTFRRTILNGDTGQLVFEFANSPASSGYGVSVGFNVGCSK